jgi:hypothetical protein
MRVFAVLSIGQRSQGIEQYDAQGLQSLSTCWLVCSSLLDAALTPVHPFTDLIAQQELQLMGVVGMHQRCAAALQVMPVSACDDRLNGALRLACPGLEAWKAS